MRIKKIIAVPTITSYYYEDVEALQVKPVPDAERYQHPAKNNSLRFLREPGEAVSVGLLLEDGRLAWGDCVSVADGGKAGRKPVFRALLN
jgi:methylaspartate ammonia-lyase